MRGRKTAAATHESARRSGELAFAAEDFRNLRIHRNALTLTAG
jgi:hypothetical protein